MVILTEKEAEKAMPFLKEAARTAERALCLKAKCGSVIVADGVIISAGYNAPPHDDILLRKCTGDYTHSSKPKSDRTCCMHAEWRAIIHALRNTAPLLRGATLYFIRVDEHGRMLHSHEPYCTVCSRLALDVGISTFVLWRDEGVCVYDTKEYNERSYAFHQKPVG